MNTQNITATHLYDACHKIMNLAMQLFESDKEAQSTLEAAKPTGKEIIECVSELVYNCDMFASLIIGEADDADQYKDTDDSGCAYNCYQYLDATLRLLGAVHYRTTDLLFAIERVEELFSYLKPLHDSYFINNYKSLVK